MDQQYGKGDGVDPLESEKRWRLPERAVPELILKYGPRIGGKIEPWGHSDLTEDASGDQVLFRTIEEFNRKYGPSLMEQFFRANAQDPTKSVTNTTTMLEEFFRKKG